MSEENNIIPPQSGNPFSEGSPAEEPKKVDSISQLKSVTQNLKSITSPIAPQANLRNTGIMAGNQMTEKQREASKARTSRISLSSAIGVAEVKDEATPMKTIKIQRPKLAPRSALSKPATVAKVDSSTQTPSPAAAQSASEVQSPTVTQKKTLKIARPAVGVARGKLAIKKPSAQPVSAETEVDDIPDINAVETSSVSLNDVQPISNDAGQIKAVSKTAAIVGLIVQLAACAVVGVLAYYLYQDYMLPLYCGGCTP